MNKIKKLLCSFLAVCIISTTLAQPVQAFTGAEGAILGGGAAAGVGISLSAPQVALILAAGFGLVFAVEHADELAESLTIALNTAAAGVDAGAETLAQWLETAKKGSIAIATAPVWIAGAIKGWISSLYQADNSSPSFSTSPCQSVSAGTIVQHLPDFWSTTWTNSYTEDVILTYYGYADDNSDGTVSCFVYAVAFSENQFKKNNYKNGNLHYPDSSRRIFVDGKEYYFYESTFASTISTDTTSEYERNALASCASLPDYHSLPHNNKNDASNPRLTNAIRAALDGGVFTPSQSVCPDVKVGGIGSVLEQGKSIDDVNMPDLDVSGSKSICPDGVLDGSIPIADTVADVIAGLTDGSLSWSDYVSDVAVGTPSISVPVEGAETGVVDYPITDTGVSDVPIEEAPDQSGEVDVPEGLAPYTVQLKDFFPFCIPFDIVDFVGVLCADPVAPSFEWTFTQYSGQKDTLEIDLSPFDQVAQLLRNMELLLFIIGLAFLTRNLIRG